MKKKRELTENQKRAINRNWSKGLIVCSLKHFEGLKKRKGLSMHESMKILKCKVILEEILDDWKPTL